MKKQEILKIIEHTFDEHVSAEPWQDFGTSMARLCGKQDFLNLVSEKIQDSKPLPFDYTFPTRLTSFVKDIQATCPMGEEEKEYMERVAAKLLQHQIETATDQNEVDYLTRLHKK